eukprot:2528837-Rhodomonas_salina.2
MECAAGAATTVGDDRARPGHGSTRCCRKGHDRGVGGSIPPVDSCIRHALLAFLHPPANVGMLTSVLVTPGSVRGTSIGSDRTQHVRLVGSDADGSRDV